MRSARLAFGRLGCLAVDEPVHVLATNPDPSVAHPDRGQFPGGHIVPDGHLIEAQ